MTPVSELLALKIENLQLRIEQLQALHAQLHGQQQTLLEEARKEVGATAEATKYDFATRLFTSPNGTKPLSAPPGRRAKRMNGRP